MILYRYAVYKGYDVSIGEDTNILSYADFADLSEYAIPAMQWALRRGDRERHQRKHPHTAGRGHKSAGGRDADAVCGGDRLKVKAPRKIRGAFV